MVGLASWGRGEETRGLQMGLCALLGSEGSFPCSPLAPARLTRSFLLQGTLGPQAITFPYFSSFLVE